MGNVVNHIECSDAGTKTVCREGEAHAEPSSLVEAPGAATKTMATSSLTRTNLEIAW